MVIDVIVIASSQGDSRILMQKLTRDRLQASGPEFGCFVRFFSCSYICGDFEYESFIECVSRLCQGLFIRLFQRRSCKVLQGSEILRRPGVCQVAKWGGQRS